MLRLSAEPLIATISRRQALLAPALILRQAAIAAGLDAIPLNCSPCDQTIACFEPHDFRDSKGAVHRVYVGGKGPPVVVLHELPGLTPHDIRLAKMLIKDGYTAIVPLLFGAPGDDREYHYLFSICGKDQFACNANGRTPKPVEWIREFCGKIRDKWPDGLGIGVIGMCLTGLYPLALLSVKDVLAPVLCQPTSPISIFAQIDPLRLWQNRAIGLSAADLDYARDHSDAPILGIRYDRDRKCPPERFDELSKRFQKRFYRLDLQGGGHSSLGHNLCDLAYEEVRRFLRHRLVSPEAAAGEPFPLHAQPGAINVKPLKLGCSLPASACPEHAH